FEMVSHLAFVGPLSASRKANLARPARERHALPSATPQSACKCAAGTAPSASGGGLKSPQPMRIDKIIESKSPVFSVEFFPPKTAEATEQLFPTALSLRELGPDFVSVTYGAGGSTREGTVEITKRLK